MICPVHRGAREAAREIVARNQFPEGFSAAGGGAGAGAVPPADAGAATITGMENTRDTAPSGPSVSMLAVIMNTPGRLGISTI